MAFRRAPRYVERIMFQTWAFLLPALIALMVPAVAAWRLERKEPRLALRDGALALGALLVNVFLLWSFSGAPFASALKVAGFSIGFAGFVAGAFVMLVACRARPAAAQAAVAVVVVLLLSSVFVAAPAIDAAPLAEKTDRAQMLVDVNPYAVIALDALGVDILHGKLYETHLADYVSGCTSWWRAAGGYLLVGLLLAGIGLGVHRAVGA